MTKEESLQKSTAIPKPTEEGFDNIVKYQGKIAKQFLRVLACEGNHRYFVAETFAVEGEGTVGAVIICTSCGESKLITHKVAREGCSVLLKPKGEKQ